MKNIFSGYRIEYHILQSFPVTCLNRDDVGSPKSAVIGGVKRARVSSQCWKRQVRLAMHEMGVSLAVRSKKVAERIVAMIPNASEAQKQLAALVAKELATDTLVFISDGEIKAVADYIVSLSAESSALLGTEKSKEKDAAIKAFKKGFKDKIKEGAKKSFKVLEGLDIVLFGRMIANYADLNVEAAASFSHAITTHEVVGEFDYFTAVDDLKASNEDEADSGAGHIGLNEFNSGTYYRYISLDLGMLYDYIGDVEDVIKAVDAFTKALYVAVPNARQTTQSGQCDWDFAHILVRKGQGKQLCFDKPVRAKGEGFSLPSIEAMEDMLETKKKLAGSLYGEVAEVVYGKGKCGIDEVIKLLSDTIATIGK